MKIVYSGGLTYIAHSVHGVPVEMCHISTVIWYRLFLRNLSDTGVNGVDGRKGNTFKTRTSAKHTHTHIYIIYILYNVHNTNRPRKRTFFLFLLLCFSNANHVQETRKPTPKRSINIVSHNDNNSQYK